MPDSDSENQNARATVRFALGQGAMMRGEWEEARRIFADELAVTGLDDDHQGAGRLGYCEALIQTALRQVDDASKAARLDEAITQGRAACLLVARASFDDGTRSEAHQLLGTAIGIRAVLWPAGSASRTELMKEAIALYEKALTYDANNTKAAEQLERARRVKGVNLSGSSKTGCFVVTAACGSYFAPEVVLLTNFRDTVLSRHWLGRLLIRLYYLVAPNIAAFVSTSAWKQAACRRLVVAPSILVVRRMKF